MKSCLARCITAVAVASFGVLVACNTEQHIASAKIGDEGVLDLVAHDQSADTSDASPDRQEDGAKTLSTQVDNTRAVGLSVWIEDPGHTAGLSPDTLSALLGDPNPTQDPACRGGWQYRMFDCFREGSGPVCGMAQDEVWEEVVEYNGCTHPDFGLAGTRFFSDEAHRVVFDQKLEGRDWCSPTSAGGRIPIFGSIRVRPKSQPLQWAIDKSFPDVLAAAVRDCRAHQQGQLNSSGRANWKADCRDLTRLDDPQHLSGKHCFYDKARNNTHIYWSGHLILEEPVYNFRASDPACGRKVPVRHAKVAERRFHTCRHPDFGREAVNVCGADEQTLVSTAGARRTELPAEHFDWRPGATSEARCLTCDDLPYQNDEQLQTKLLCLKQRLHHVVSGMERTQADVDAHAALETRDETLRLSGQALFESVFSSDSVSKDFLPFYSPTGTHPEALGEHLLHTPAQTQARTHLCRALLQSHVDARRILAEFQTCLGLAGADHVDVARDDAEQASRARDEAIETTLALFGRFVRAMGSSQAPILAEAHDAHHMVDLWRAYAMAYQPHLPTPEIERVSGQMRAYIDERMAALGRLDQEH